MTDESTPSSETTTATLEESTEPVEPVEPVEAAIPKVAPAPSEPPSGPPVPFIWGTGRRKTAVARVRIRPGEGKFVINKRELDAYFLLDKDRQAVRTPLTVTDTAKSLDVYVNVGGGGITGQAGAVLLGLARALAKYNPEFYSKLKEHNLLTRDPRKVERKKPGQPGARRRFQFSKR